MREKVPENCNTQGQRNPLKRCRSAKETGESIREQGRRVSCKLNVDTQIVWRNGIKTKYCRKYEPLGLAIWSLEKILTERS